MPYMTRIPSDLARFGLRVELVPGWETRGSSSFAPACVVDHWTAGPRGTTGRPSLSVVTYGRPGLDGPLCNVYLDRKGICVVVAAGRANHAGLGGFRGLVGNSAAYGIEAECGGDGDWTPEMLEAYPRLNAALLSGLGRGADWCCGHNDWAPDRKIDIRDIIRAVQAQTAAVLANPEDDMPDEATFKKWVREAVASTPVPKSSSGVGPSDLDSYLNGIADRAASASRLGAQTVAMLQKQSGAEVDVNALAVALAPLLAPVLESKLGASKQDVEDALREVLGGLDAPA